MAQLLESHGGYQHKSISEDRRNDHKDHPGAGEVVHPPGSNVIIGAFKGTWKQEVQNKGRAVQNYTQPHQHLDPTFSCSMWALHMAIRVSPNSEGLVSL